jgi:hypothetical protein
MLRETNIYGCLRFERTSLAVTIFGLCIVYISTHKPIFRLVPLVSTFCINIPNSHATETLHMKKELHYGSRNILMEYTYSTIDKCWSSFSFTAPSVSYSALQHGSCKKTMMDQKAMNNECWGIKKKAPDLDLKCSSDNASGQTSGVKHNQNISMLCAQIAYHDKCSWGKQIQLQCLRTNAAIVPKNRATNASFPILIRDSFIMLTFDGYGLTKWQSSRNHTQMNTAEHFYTRFFNAATVRIVCRPIQPTS